MNYNQFNRDKKTRDVMLTCETFPKNDSLGKQIFYKNVKQHHKHQIDYN